MREREDQTFPPVALARQKTKNWKKTHTRRHRRRPPWHYSNLVYSNQQNFHRIGCAFEIQSARPALGAPVSWCSEDNGFVWTLLCAAAPSKPQKCQFLTFFELLGGPGKTEYVRHCARFVHSQHILESYKRRKGELHGQK